MQLTVLGASGTYPTPSSPASGYLLGEGGHHLWVDAGSGTFAALQRRVSIDDLSGVFLSHEHADHCADAIGLFYAVRYGELERPRIPVFCPAAVAAALGRFVGAADEPFADVAEFTDPTVTEGIRLGPLCLSFAPTNHPVPTLALRAESGGRSFVYTADTGPSDDVVGLAEGANVLLAEATYQGTSEDKPWPHHLTAAEAGQIARQAGVERLILTHIWPEFDPQRSLWEAGEQFDGEVVLASPEASFDI